MARGFEIDLERTWWKAGTLYLDQRRSDSSKNRYRLETVWQVVDSHLVTKNKRNLECSSLLLHVDAQSRPVIVVFVDSTLRFSSQIFYSVSIFPQSCFLSPKRLQRHHILCDLQERLKQRNIIIRN